MAWDDMNRRRGVLRQLADLGKARPCDDCGGRFPACAMDYDHRPGTAKTANVSVLCRTGPASRVFNEIAKCDVVCANCHRVRTRDRLEN